MNRILAIELKRFGGGRLQAGKKLFPGRLLAVDTGDFLDPSDLPVAILLGYRSVGIGHNQSPHEEGYHISILLSTRQGDPAFCIDARIAHPQFAGEKACVPHLLQFTELLYSIRSNTSLYGAEMFEN